MYVMANQNYKGRNIQQAPRRKNRQEEWPYEREGYNDVPQPAYASAPPTHVDIPPTNGRFEAFLGSVLAGCGAVWTAQVMTQSGLTPGSLTLNSHPVELTGLGLLLWLHGKWRKSTQVR